MKTFNICEVVLLLLISVTLSSAGVRYSKFLIHLIFNLLLVLWNFALNLTNLCFYYFPNSILKMVKLKQMR